MPYDSLPNYRDRLTGSIKMHLLLAEPSDLHPLYNLRTTQAPDFARTQAMSDRVRTSLTELLGAGCSPSLSKRCG